MYFPCLIIIILVVYTHLLTFGCTIYPSRFDDILVLCILPVLPVKSGECRRWRHIPATAPSGYIASITALETWCGTSDTPWIIEALPGQRINITLHDFGVANDYEDSQSSWDYGGMDSNCDVNYAVIKEEDPHRSTSVCGGHQRQSHVYTSIRNKVEIQLIPRSRLTTNYFLLHYQGE